MQGQRGKYQDAKGNVFNVTPEHAEKMGLQPVGEPFVVQSSAADVEPPKEKAMHHAPHNKAVEKGEDK